MRAPQMVVTVPLGEPVRSVPADPRFVSARAFFRLGDAVVGSAPVPIVGDRARSADLADAAVSECAEDIAEELVARHLLDPGTRGRPTPQDLDPARRKEAGPAVGESLPSITVAICTRDRPDDLRLALDSLAKVDYPDWDVLVVDNAPSDDRTRDLVAQYPGVRYQREPRAGLDWARNAAVLASDADVIAFLDDDAVAEPGWLRGVGTFFANDPAVGAVTGPVLPLELETPAQLMFEDKGGFNRGFRRRWFTQQLDTGAFGTGANMSLRREAIADVGLFDPALDVGTPTGGGGDLELLFRVVRAGWFVGYEPGAVVWHRHRREVRDLDRQLVGYGGAVGAYLLRTARTDPTQRKAAAVTAVQFSWKLLKDALQSELDPTRRPSSTNWRALSRFAGSRRHYRDAVEQARREEAAHGPLAQDLPVDELLRVRPEHREPPRGRATRHVDLSQPLPALTGLGDAMDTHVVVRDGERLVGQLWIRNRGHDIPPFRLATEIAHALGTRLLDAAVAPDWRSPYFLHTGRSAPQLTRAELVRVLRDHLRGEEEPEPPLPSASIVLATLDRPDDLDVALRSLAGQVDAPPHEIIVVDNNPASGLTPPVVARHPGVKLVPEERQGLAYARNAGIGAATNDVVVCTDDDVTFPENWLREIVRPFTRRDVMAVCGRVVPVELETPAQVTFETYGGLDRGEVAWVANRDSFFRRVRVVPTWELGATANAAFRRSIFADPEMGPFEESLGPGTPTGVGEDTFVFYRILNAGYSIAYHPDAWVMHRHRRTMEALESQLAAYSRGQVSYQLTTLLTNRDLRALHQLLYCIPRYTAVELARSITRRDGALPARVRLLELKNFVRAPLALRESRRRADRLGRTTVDDLR